jgi:ABC-type phosphate/phosphonate transport system substrate-binding protein
MRKKSLLMAPLSGLVLLLATTQAAKAGDAPVGGCCSGTCCSEETQAKVLRIGAVAHAPGAVTVFEGIRRYLDRNGLPVDYVLYSNYDALVEALQKRQVDIAWNTPLAHARYHLKAGNASQALVMREVDCDFRSVLIVRADANIRSLDDVKGKTMILGSWQAAEATILPIHFLKSDGLRLSRVKFHNLDGLVDLRGNPCSSEVHVLKALREERGQAGIIGERLWNRLSKEQPDQVRGLRVLWTSPAFSHCVFTASKDFDQRLASRFTKLMLAMDPNDPSTAEAMRLEGTRRWVAGSHEGFQELQKALRQEAGCCSAGSCE